MSECLVTLRPRGERPGVPRLRLVVAPPSGAGPQYARPLLAPDVDLWAARYPGRESRRAEPFAASVDELADELAPLVAQVHAENPLPLVLLGNSMGAGVAAALARRLVGRLPRVVRGLVLAGRVAPGVQDPRADDELRAVARDDARLTAWVAALGGTPPELLADPDVRAMLLPVLRADLLVSLDHDGLAGPVLDLPLVLVCGDEDPIVTTESMRGWSALTHGPVTELSLSGGHHAVVESTHPVLDAVRSLALDPAGART